MKPPPGWPTDLVEEWSERAALIEDGCKVSREESERMSYEQLKHRATNPKTTKK